MVFIRRTGPYLLLALLLGAIAALAPAIAAIAKEGDLKLRWAFGAIRAASAVQKVEPVGGQAVLASGDKLKMMVEIRKKCFVYLIHNNTQGEVAMLFPYSLKQFDTDYQTSRKYYIPKGDAWFQLDARTGRETFYLIASDQRLLDIEYIYEKYVAAEPVKRRELAGLMLAEINTLKEHYLASGRGEVLARSESDHRGFERATGADPTDITALAKEVAFKNLYSETFVIDHR